MMVGHIAFVCALTLSVSELANAQSFVGKYGPVKSPQFQSVREVLQRGKFLEEIAATLSQGITLPHQVVLTIGECGKATAFYNPKFKAIVVCYELMSEMIQATQRDLSPLASRQEIEKLFSGGFGFILMHELSHALIHILDLPVLGREEDAADQIAAFFLLHTETSESDMMLEGAIWLFRSKTFLYTRRHFSDEHSVGPQRQSNLACWAFGKDPNRYQYLLRRGYLTRERAVRCGSEYTLLDSSVRKLLGSNVRLPSQ